MYNIIVTILICSTISIFSIIFLNARCIRQISIEKEKTVRLYLDRQLVTKMIHRLIDAAPLQNIINDAKKYFLLDKIVIFKIPHYTKDLDKPLSNEIYSYMKDNMDIITEYLSHNKFLNVQRDHLPVRLLIQYLDSKKKHFVIYAINSADTLDQNDIDILTDAVTPIIYFFIHEFAKIGNSDLRNGGFEKT